jgi:hypothetical protein
MKPICAYIIVGQELHGKDPHEQLAGKVNDWLKDNFQPYGEPFFAEGMLYQPMVQYGKPKLRMDEIDEINRARRRSALTVAPSKQRVRSRQ